MMELAGGGSLSESLYHGVSAESTLGGTRTALGDVPWCSIPTFLSPISKWKSHHSDSD